MKKFAVLIYTDEALMDALPEGAFEERMRHCLDYADGLRERGSLQDSQMLEGREAARTLRVRNGRRTITDGPFAETKELLAGFNLIEAEDMDAAVRIAEAFPWSETGAVEIREIRDIGAVREQVGGAIHAG
jgi:hypothetical protein